MEQFATVKDRFAYITSAQNKVHVNFLTSRPTPFHFSSAVDFNPENYFFKKYAFENVSELLLKLNSSLEG